VGIATLTPGSDFVEVQKTRSFDTACVHPELKNKHTVYLWPTCGLLLTWKNDICLLLICSINPL
jgi:hypothetical protein